MKGKFILGFVFLILLSSFTFGTIEPDGLFYYNFFDMTDQWNSYDATNSGTVTDSSYPVFNISGDSTPSSANWDGSTDYINTNYNPDTNYTLSLWAYISDAILNDSLQLFLELYSCQRHLHQLI